MSARRLAELARALSDTVDAFEFAEPVTHVYNPLAYAWKSHAAYIRRFGGGRKRVVMMGMNPGPWGMAQTGVPFGEVEHVRGWMGITAAVDKPEHEHPRRPVAGFDCTRSEVSGRRLWSLFAERFGTPEAFFRDHFVVNYCPLVFMGESGKNLTPDKLPAADAKPLFEACDAHLRGVVDVLQPEHLVAVGSFAESCLKRVTGDGPVSRILHPSPASPAANRDWAGTATRQLLDQGVW